jgi:ABC-type sugar transport system ATPase subunit
MASIAFVNVGKRYNDVVAVANLDLSCAAGEMLALLGPSGCGKSTTLKMAAGLEDASSGEIFFDDRPVSRLAPGARNIAMVFEDYALYPRMTVAQNIAYPLKVRGMERADADARVADALRLLRLEDLADVDVKGLSGGAQQRVSIGRALVRDPALILFDEPLSHLDADQKVQLRAEIKRLQKLKHVTSILVTHDQTEAIAMADRIAVMNHGVLQQLGSPQDLYHRPANLFVANFIGEPPMNLAHASVLPDGSVAGSGWHTRISPDLARIDRIRPGNTLVVGVRPEHISLHAEVASAPMSGVLMSREPRGDADVLSIEMTGELIGGAPAQVFVVEVAGPSAFRPGQHVGVTLDAARVHLFDAETGKRFGVSP